MKTRYDVTFSVAVSLSKLEKQLETLRDKFFGNLSLTSILNDWSREGKDTEKFVSIFVLCDNEDEYYERLREVLRSVPPSNYPSYGQLEDEEYIKFFRGLKKKKLNKKEITKIFSLFIYHYKGED